MPLLILSRNRKKPACSFQISMEKRNRKNPHIMKFLGIFLFEHPASFQTKFWFSTANLSFIKNIGKTAFYILQGTFVSVYTDTIPFRFFSQFWICQMTGRNGMTENSYIIQAVQVICVTVG